MKLYNENQLNNAIDLAKRNVSKEAIIEYLKPIELPSEDNCINCDELKSTHNICMDCIIKIGKENIELPSEEEIEKAANHYSRQGHELEFKEGAKWLKEQILKTK